MTRTLFVFVCAACLGVALSMSLVKPTGSCRNVTISSTLKLVVTIIGKSYFADSTPMNWLDARSYCKSLGFQLASITTIAQSKALKSVPHSPNINGLHWTSGRDSYLARQFTWDSTLTAVSSDYLEFSTKSEMFQTCLAYFISTEAPHLTHATCTNAYKVLCEATD